MRTLLLTTVLFSNFALGEEIIRNAILTENLEHPPRLEQCMRKIFPFNVKRFIGPILGDDKLRVDYAAVSDDGSRYLWRFRPALNAQWKAFLYETPQGSAVGVSTSAMVATADIVPPEKAHSHLAVDLRPCRQFFRGK